MVFDSLNLKTNGNRLQFISECYLQLKFVLIQNLSSLELPQAQIVHMSVYKGDEKGRWETTKINMLALAELKVRVSGSSSEES